MKLKNRSLALIVLLACLVVILIVSRTLAIPIVSGDESEENKELLNCLCRCNEPLGGQFSCYYDTEDRGWSPSCRDLSNGPCICKAYGCFRAPLPTEGECYDKCYAQYGPQVPSPSSGSPGPSSKQAAATGALASAAFVVWAILNRLSNAGTSTKSRGKGGKAGPHDDSTLSGEGGATQQGPLAKDNLEQGPLGESLDASKELLDEIEPFEKQEGRKVGKGGIIGPKEPSSIEVLCPKCGKKNDRKARFCTNCGTSLVREDR